MLWIGMRSTTGIDRSLLYLFGERLYRERKTLVFLPCLKEAELKKAVTGTDSARKHGVCFWLIQLTARKN